MPVNLWYIDLSVNNHNSKAYIDMVNDMRELGNGVFSATLRLNESCITDYVWMRNANRKATKDNKATR